MRALRTEAFPPIAHLNLLEYSTITLTHSARRTLLHPTRTYTRPQVQCRNGNLARAAGRNLRARGFEKVYVLGENEGEPHACNSGFPDWQAAGYPTTDVSITWPAPQCF